MRTARSSSRAGGVSTRHPPEPKLTYKDNSVNVNRMTDRCKNITLPKKVV